MTKIKHIKGQFNEVVFKRDGQEHTVFIIEGLVYTKTRELFTGEITGKHNAKVIEEKVKGYGSAIRKGISSAKKEFILLLDGDATYDPLCLGKMLNLYEQKNLDLIIGNRFDDGIERGAMSFLHRFLGNPVLSSINRLAFSSIAKFFAQAY